MKDTELSKKTPAYPVKNISNSTSNIAETNIHMSNVEKLYEKITGSLVCL